MPIPSPVKPGEMDYVDLSLLPKIKLKNETLERLGDHAVVSVSMKLLADPEKYDDKTVVLRADIPLESGDKEKTESVDHTFELEEFERIMSRLCYEGKNERLESTPEYQEAVATMLDAYIEKKWKEAVYLARYGVVYRKTKGIGIIRDLKADQDVGTFEGIEYRPDHSDPYLKVLDIHAPVRSINDLSAKERYAFVFYSLEDATIYRIRVINPDGIKQEESELGLTNLTIPRCTIQPDKWTDDRFRYDAVAEADKLKQELLSVRKDDFMYSDYVAKFLASRQDIIKESAQEAKKAALMQKYADIDLDL